MASNDVDRLLSLKKEIEQAKLDHASIEGAINQNLKRLKDEFGVRSVEQAQAKLVKLKEQRTELQNDIEDIVKKLEERYSW